MEDPKQPMDGFAAQVEAELEAGDYRQVLLDLRNNGGGSDGVLVPIILLVPGLVEEGVKVYGLVGEATYSSAIINAVELVDAGGVLAGQSHQPQRQPLRLHRLLHPAQLRHPGELLQQIHRPGHTAGGRAGAQVEPLGSPRSGWSRPWTTIWPGGTPWWTAAGQRRGLYRPRAAPTPSHPGPPGRMLWQAAGAPEAEPPPSPI